MASFMLWPSSLIKVYYWYKMKMFVLITTISKLSLHPTVPSHLHLLCVDMTGYEGTTRTNTDDYSIQGQVKRIRHQGCIKLNTIQEIDEFYIFIFGNQNESKFDSQMHEAEHSQYTLNIPLILSTPEEMLKLCSHTSFVFQHDLAPAHSAKTTGKWFTDHGITVLNWPANSPDLNPIENLWDIVKRKLRDARPNTLDELKAAIEASWASITPQQCHRLIASMPRRIEAVIFAKGFLTKY
uniref:Tc1-like transposase DDE domain-containing protein n=1 Tax=Cyprinus carpio TaxID=7962 RepID=A0A8C2FU98_CYPCA